MAARRSAIDHLLGEIVDSHVKLDVLVFLYRAQGATRTSAAIASALDLPSGAVAEALCALGRDGVVSTCNDDGAEWSVEPLTGWSQAISSIADLHARERGQLLRRIVWLALQDLQPDDRIAIRPKCQMWS